MTNPPITITEARQAIEAALASGNGCADLCIIAHHTARHDAVGRMSRCDWETFKKAAEKYPQDRNGQVVTPEYADRQRRYAMEIRQANEQHDREESAGFSRQSPEMTIGRVVWEIHTPHVIHTIDGAEGRSPRWVRLLAAREWPGAGGIQVVRVRITADDMDEWHTAQGVRQITLDLSPERMDIDATAVGSPNIWGA
jgi:hypothetical protein